MENCSGAVLVRTGVRENNLIEHQKSVGLCRSLKENGHRPGLPQPSFMCTGKGSTVPHADEDHIRQHLSIHSQFSSPRLTVVPKASSIR